MFVYSNLTTASLHFLFNLNLISLHPLGVKHVVFIIPITSGHRLSPPSPSHWSVPVRLKTTDNSVINCVLAPNDPTSDITLPETLH